MDQDLPVIPPAEGHLPEPALAAEAVAKVLRPLARLAIDHGLQLPAVIDLLKKALVEEAMQTYALEGKEGKKGSSDTRISLLTGVHRKDVRRLRTEAEQEQSIPLPMLPLAAVVVARWISDPRFLNTDQTARPLARTPKHRQEGLPDFTMLVAEVSKDVGARAVLDELIRLGAVDTGDDGLVRLKSHGFVPKDGLRESFHFLADNVSEHLSAAVHNMNPYRQSNDMPPKLEQCIFSHNLSREQVDELHNLARNLWSKSLQPFLQAATVAEQRSQSSPEPLYQIRFGVYFNDSPVKP
jgi:hypothetical protein